PRELPFVPPLMRSRSGALPAAMNPPRWRAIIVAPRSWKSSRVRRRCMRLSSGRVSFKMPSGDNWPGDGRCHTEHPVYRFHSKWSRVIFQIRTRSALPGSEGKSWRRKVVVEKNRMDQMLETDIDRIAGFNRTDRYFPDQVSLLELIEARIGQLPLQPAVLCDHDWFWGTAVLSYAQLNERANQVAHLLRGNGVRAGHIVGILVERCFAMVIGIFGIMKAGAAYLPLSPDDPPDRIRYVLADAGVGIVLVHGATAPKAPPGIPVINLEQTDVYIGPSHNPDLVNKPGDLAYVIYTSGSTGKPKGVMIEHRSVVNRLHWIQRAYPIDQRDRILQKTSY